MSQPSENPEWKLAAPAGSQSLHPSPLTSHPSEMQTSDEDRSRSIPIPSVASGSHLFGHTDEVRYMDFGECGTDDIQKLITVPVWKPWGRSAMCTTISGVREGWYQNRSQNIAVYMFTELILGLVTVFAQVPETISFSLMAGIDPSLGLHGAWSIGLLSTIFSGRGGVVYGVTGSVSSVTASLIAATGRKDLLFPIVITSGLLLILFSAFNLSWLLRFISKNVMIGFCNGLAIIIAIAQFHMFETPDHTYVQGEIAGHMAFMCLSAGIIFNWWGKVPLVGKYFPGAFAALIFVCLYEGLIVWLWRGIRTVSIGDIGRLDPDYRFPRFFWNLPGVESYSMSDIATILSKSLSFFLVMCLESLMTIDVMDVVYNNKSNKDQSIMAIGLGNVLSGLIGGLGGNTMIGLCGLLHRSGGCGKEAPLICSIMMFIVVTCLSPYLNYFPTAGLAGIMFVVVLHTFSFDSMGMIICSIFPSKLVHKKRFLQRRIPRLDAFILLLVTIFVPLFGLDIGILIGMILSAFQFVDSSYRKVQVYKHTAIRPTVGECAVYDIVGPLFFSSADLVHDSFDVSNDPNTVIIRMNNSSIMDYSALEALSEVRQKYEAKGKEVHIKYLTKGCEEKINLSQARLDWDKADFENYEVDVPRLVQFADELPLSFPGMPMNVLTSEHPSVSATLYSASRIARSEHSFGFGRTNSSRSGREAEHLPSPFITAPNAPFVEPDDDYQSKQSDTEVTTETAVDGNSSSSHEPRDII